MLTCISSKMPQPYVLCNSSTLGVHNVHNAHAQIEAQIEIARLTSTALWAAR